MTKYELKQARKILNIRKYPDGGWFWNRYSAYPYLGCQFSCNYCYEWDKKYTPYDNPEDFPRVITIKQNAPQLLKKELENSPRDLLSLGDWQPAEAKFRISRKMLEVALEENFPVFINEKSPLLLKDLDLLRKISEKSYLNIGFSIITAQDDKTRKIFEPKAPPVKLRFEAMRKLSKEGILTGTVFIPILPFIYDTDENIKEVIKTTVEMGGKYILDGSLTLWGHCRNQYFKTLKKFNPSLIKKYEDLYTDPEKLRSYYQEVHQKVKYYCEKYQIANYIPRPVDYFPEHLRINKIVSAHFYLKSREAQLNNEPPHREFAYRKAAMTLENLDKNLTELYKTRGRKGLLSLPSIGKGIATEIEKIFLFTSNSH